MKIIGAIIAGGLSSRMGGREKAFLELDSKPVILHVIEQFEPQVDQLVINANGDATRFSEFGLEVVPDVLTSLTTPLAGLHAALRFTKSVDADVLMTVDAGDLWRATEAGLLATVRSKALESAIPAHLRDPRGRWFGLAVRARTIAYSTERVKPGDLSTYAALGDARWKGELCLRSGKHVYNQSLVALMIAEMGEEATENLVRSWIANLAAAPFSSDTLLLNAIAAGQCDVGVVNSYYLGRLQNDKPGYPVQIFWADQQAGGTHVNISGAGVTRHAKNRAEAIRFLEWLATPEIQARFTRANFEYAANPAVEPAPVVAAWGPFKHKLVNVGQIGALQPAAVRLMDRAGWR